MYIKTTHHIKVTVNPGYLDNQSEPSRDLYVWAYTIRIENLGQVDVKLLGRHWQITNGHGHVQEVSGEGVIGEQPLIKSGGHYEYTSGAALATPSGIMVGKFQMVEVESGALMNVDIPAFSLDSPYQVIRSH